MVLNRADDAFADFTREPSISLQAMSPDPRFTGIWNFLRQVILAKELAVRLQALEATLSFPGFTHRVLASLIVSDLWLNHVDIVLADLVINTDALKKEPGAREKAAAESFRKKGDEAMSKGEYKEAVGHYATAIQADPGNAVHRCNLSAARLADGALADAENDVYMATQLDPQSPRAWSFLGAARLKRGHSRRSEEAYERALSVAGQDEAATAAAREGLADARARTARTRTDMAQEPDPERRHRLRSVFLEQDYDIVGRNVNVRSRVHERQIDGLLAFARTLRWPHLADVRATAEAAYAGILVGRNVNVCLYDWLLGLMLPGKWFASIIMESLVQCSPSIRDRVGFAPSFECGLALPGASYWRCRTVLARVLGCRPGAAALCGWVGPCPPVAFDPPADVSEPPRYVLIRAQKAAMLEPGDSSSWLGPRIWQEQKLKRPAERASAFVAEMRDASRWTVPPPPALNDCVCETVEIRLSRLPPSEPEKKSGAEYRASVVVRLDKSPSPVTYTLLTNPVFVTLPPCRPRTLSGVPSLHDVHERELHRFKQRVWSVTELKGYTPEDAAEPGDVTVVNATGKGAEVLARAWCAEYGKNAAIRRPGGPCFACAVRAANGLDIRVLIWLD
jgi:tetratricopeptide (TPR) repeat protein